MHKRPRYRGFRRRTNGFTLLESMLAASLLFVIVVAVLSAITSGQQHAYESHLRIAGTLAAEDLMGRLSTASYSTLPSWDGHKENVGAMTDADSVAMPAMFNMIGRKVTVTTSIETLPNGVKVRGHLLLVQAFGRDNRVVASMQQFVLEPGP
jgi:type II secretory pathway pseudopilin PulG